VSCSASLHTRSARPGAEARVAADGEFQQQGGLVALAELEDINEVAGLGAVEQGDQLADGDLLLSDGGANDGRRGR
jgi:hypothetical protein